MLGKAVYKVPGGKLLKVTVEHEEGRIISARVNGDFFAHPEDSIEKLEQTLEGARLEDVADVVASSLSGAELYGVDTESITKTLLEAIR